MLVRVTLGARGLPGWRKYRSKTTPIISPYLSLNVDENLGVTCLPYQLKNTVIWNQCLHNFIECQKSELNWFLIMNLSQTVASTVSWTVAEEELPVG